MLLFGPPLTLPSGGVESSYGGPVVAIGDLDGDGRADLAAIEWSSAGIRVFWNDCR